MHKNKNELFLLSLELYAEKIPVRLPKRSPPIGWARIWKVDSDLISSVAVDDVGMDVCGKFCDSTSTVLEIFEGLIVCQTNE